MPKHTLVLNSRFHILLALVNSSQEGYGTLAINSQQDGYGTLAAVQNPDHDV